ncbi:MAG: PhaM family polyhydroxyalkanoate granule multifunctional regulatory protein [Pseudomonadota bacterium]
MPTRPSSPDPSGQASDNNPFAGLSAAGLGFFQDWMKAASSALPNLGGSAAGTGAAWTMPTLDPEELDKRIQDLKTVQFWLEQNARMIGMTIQTLEVQRMTLQTLQGMKVPLDALRESLQAQATPPVSPTPSAAPAAKAASAGAGEDAAAGANDGSDDTPSADAPTPPPGVNPMQWWSTLTEQFSNLASQAVQAGQEAMSATARPAPTEAPAAPAKPATRRPNPSGKARAAKPGTPRKAPPKP